MLDPARLVFIDETAVSTDMARIGAALRGRARDWPRAAIGKRSGWLAQRGSGMAACGTGAAAARARLQDWIPPDRIARAATAPSQSIRRRLAEPRLPRRRQRRHRASLRARRASAAARACCRLGPDRRGHHRYRKQSQHACGYARNHDHPDRDDHQHRPGQRRARPWPGATGWECHRFYPEPG